jgi:hypothetical protein
LAVSHPGIFRFNTTNPIHTWGSAIADWEFLTANDQGSGGGLMRVVGLCNLPTPPEFPSPIQPDAQERLLYSLYGEVVDPMVDTLCDFLGSISVDFTDFSDSAGIPLPASTEDGQFEIICPLCGDVNSDSLINVSDVVYMICWVFGTCEPPWPPEIADVDCSDFVNVSDLVYLINYVFGDGPHPCAECPPPPYQSTVMGTLNLQGTRQDLQGTQVALYTSLENWSNYSPSYFVIVTESGTTVNYQIANAAAGNYYLDAWKDNDSDGLISIGDYFGWHGLGTYPNIILTQFVLEEYETEVLDIELAEVTELLRK